MEGPSLVILREEVASFEGKTFRGLAGNTTLDISPLENQEVKAFKSCGKHFIIEFDSLPVGKGSEGLFLPLL